MKYFIFEAFLVLDFGFFGVSFNQYSYCISVVFVDL